MCLTGSRQLTANKLTGDNWFWSTDRQQIGRRHKPIGNKLAGDTNQPLYTNQPLVVSTKVFAKIQIFCFKTNEKKNSIFTNQMNI